MKLMEYLKLRGSRALTNIEARAIGINVRRGWVKKFADREVPEEIVACARLSKREKKSAIGSLRLIHSGANDRLQRRHKEKRLKRPKRSFVMTDGFLETFEWRKVRYEAIKRSNGKCCACGGSPATGAVLNVDHIKPRRLRPDLALDVNNLQVLCSPCNHGKGNWDATDWR